MKKTLLAVGIITLVSVGSAFGQSSTGNVNVTATVAKNCTITAGAVAFGAYDPLGTNLTADLDKTGSLTVTCTKGTAPGGVTLGAGNNATKASYGSRAMISGGGAYLGYELFTDSGYQNPWTTTTSVTPTDPTWGVTHPVTLTIFGRVGKGQDVPPGSYVDSVVATVNF